MGFPNVHVTNGEKGLVKITSGAPFTNNGRLSVIKALGGDVVIAAATGEFAAGTLDGLTLSNGDFIPGMFTAVTVTSGTLLGFR